MASSSSESAHLSGSGIASVPVNLEKYDIVGFDLDGCIAEYDREEILRTIYARMSPQLKLPPLSPDTKISGWVQTGLVLDLTEGLLVKLSYKRKVVKAFRGFNVEPLDSAAVRRVEERVQQHFAADTDLPALTATGVAESWRRTGLKMFLDSLELPKAYASMEVITKGATKQFYDRVHDAWTSVFDTEEVISAQHIKPCSPSLMKGLMKVVDGRHRAVFLLTATSPRRCSSIAKAALGSDWQRYFNFVVTEAPKPGFFLQDDAFSAVDAGRLTHLKGFELSVPVGGRGVILSHGSFIKLVRKS